MVRQNYGSRLFSESLNYPQTTREEEMMYGRAIRKVVDANPKIISATNIVLLDDRASKGLLGIEETELEKKKKTARKYLESFNNPWERKEEVEYWLKERDKSTWEKFPKLKKYDASKKALVTANLRLAMSGAIKFSNSRLSVEDSFQIANMGLEKAVLRYDPERNVKFGTYAFNWIEQMLLYFLPREIYKFPIPNYLFQAIPKIKEIQRELFEKNGIIPSLEQIINSAKSKGISPEAVKSALRVKETTTTHIGSFEDGGVDLEDKSLDYSLSRTIQAEDKEAIYKMMNCLDERERKVIALRFGIDEYHDSDKEQEPMTLREIGGLIGGVTPERVRQIQNVALEKMSIRHSNFSL